MRGVSLNFQANRVTAMIGPSGCGKSTLVRCINRMHEEIPGARATGKITLDDLDLYDDSIDVVSVRRSVGMVFQKPNPFPTMSIFDNVAAGLRLTGRRGEIRERVEKSLRGAGLWDEVKDRLGAPGIGLSGGQQQRLCIARTIAVEPEVILMDEPCSALDPLATLRDRGADRGSQAPLHDRHRHPQHAAGRARCRRDGVHAQRGARRVRADRADLHLAARLPDRGVRHGQVRLTGTRQHFQQELHALEAQALGALDLVVSALDRTMEALHHQDIELASIVILDDDRLDGRYLEVHQGILSLLALQAPVASDLRTVAALLHVIKHAERMGDQCVNIAKMLPLSGHEPPTDAETLDKIEQMGRLVRSEVEQSKQAFSLRDVELAEDLVRQDEQVNCLNREIFRRAVEIGTDADTREWAMTMMLVSRALERIGDNAVDIGEQVAFVVTGLFREFSDASHPGK